MNAAAHGEVLIRYENVDKSFADLEVYRDLNLEVNKGETITVIGPSGVGKSVLIKMLIGLIPVDGGRIFFDGENVAELDGDDAYLHIRQRVAMVFQNAALFDSMTVYDNIAYPLREQMDLEEGEIKRRVAEKLEWVGLPGIEENMPSELSGGMRKRVGLARSIATDPEVILYDEPTTGLDPVNCRRIGDLILSLRDRLKCTSVVVSHDVQTIFQVSDRLAFIYDKKVLETGKPEVMREQGHPVVQGFLRGDPETFKDE
jgi:phospholipid/cholesterol/gamma-HCH transport system ATP-binding protein